MDELEVLVVDLSVKVDPLFLRRILIVILGFQGVELLLIYFKKVVIGLSEVFKDLIKVVLVKLQLHPLDENPVLHHSLLIPQLS